MSSGDGYLAYLRGLPRDALEQEIDSKMADNQYALINEGEVCSAIAETNAAGWGVDDYEVEDIDVADDACRVKINWSAQGKQLEEKPFCGSEVKGQAEVVIDDRGEVTYGEVTAKVVDW